ncbi:MAG: PAS domain S-box protein [Hafnia alvei]
MDVSLDVGDEKKPYFIVTLTIFAGLIYLLACFCITLTQHDTNLASLWFPTAATIAFLFHHRKHQWPFILIAAQLATMAANWTFFPISLFSIQLALINQVQAVVCTLLLSRFLNHKSPINGLYTWLRFVICSVILAPLFSATLAATIVSLHGLAPFNQIFGVWFMSESISVMALTPVGLLYYRGFWRKSLNERTLTESIMIIAIAMVSCFYAMQYLPFPFTFAIIPMLWAAIRLPLLQAFTSFLCVIILLAIMMAYHVVDIRSAYPSVNDVLVYTPLLLVLLPVNSVAVLMHAFRLERDHIEESETRFRNVIEFSAIGTALVALDGRWIQVNPALCQMLGYPARTLTDMTFQDITHRDDLESDLSQLSALVEGKISSYSMEKRYLHSSGTSIWTLLSVSLIRDPQGEPLYFVSQIKDISEIKNNERYK